MKMLDLCCHAGGAAWGYHLAGFDVTGIDIKPMPGYPFQFIQSDALTFPLDGFDAVHAAPPCQLWSAYRRRPGLTARSYPDLIGSLRARLTAWGGPYVIENVPGSPLREPVTYCGSSFGLDVRRHRWFESNVPLNAPPCDHSWQTPRFPPATNRANLRRTVEVGVYRIPLAVQRQAMGISWMTLSQLSQATPPAYTEHIGRQLMRTQANVV